VRDLSRLALAAVGQRRQLPLAGRADRVEAAPEGRGHARVDRVAQQPSELAVGDLPSRLAAELEVQPARVDRPRAVVVDVDPVVDPGQQLVERARVAGVEADVRHPDDRLAREALAAGAAARPLEPRFGGALA
jgi:hypothetical protein